MKLSMAFALFLLPFISYSVSNHIDSYKYRRHHDSHLAFDILSNDSLTITVSPQGFTSAGFISNDTTLQYTIFFQNTGSDVVTNITVVDSLSASLDWTSFNFISSSHPVSVFVDAQGIVSFLFLGINLPTASQDQELSTGFITFEISPLSDLPANTPITNSAIALFDSDNLVSNEVTNTIFNCEMIGTLAQPEIVPCGSIGYGYDGGLSFIENYAWYVDDSLYANTEVLILFLNGQINYNIQLIASNPLCTVTENTVITAMPNQIAPTISAYDGDLCAGESVALYSSSPTNNIWLRNDTIISTSDSIEINVAGLYMLQTLVEDCISPPAYAQINITAVPEPIISAETYSFCTGDSVLLSSSLATSNTWLWNQTEIGSDSIVFALDGGEYGLIAAQNGCLSDTVFVFINEFVLPTPVITGDLDICVGDTAVVFSSSDNYNVWSQGGFVLGNNDSLYTNFAGEYSLYLQQNNCISDTVYFSLTQTFVEPPQILTDQPLICAGGSVDLASSVADGNVWLRDAVLLSNDATITVSDIGVFQLYRIVNGCNSGISEIAVSQVILNAPQILANDLSICPGDVIAVNSSATQNNNWLYNGSIISMETSISINAGGVYGLYFSQAGCNSDTVSISVEEVNIDAPDISGEFVICNGIPVSISSSGISGNVWTLNDVFIGNTSTITAYNPGVYKVYVNADGCTSATATVVVDDAIVPDPLLLTDQFTICSGEEVVLLSSELENNVWLNEGLAFSNAQSVTTNIEGEYGLFVSDNGCSSDTLFFALSTAEGPGDVQILNVGDVLTSSLNGDLLFQWFYQGDLIPGQQTASIVISANGAYTLQVTDANGCTSQATGNFEIINSKEINSSSNLIYPNPANEIFYIRSTAGIKLLDVINMNGELVCRQNGNKVIGAIPTSLWAEGVYTVRWTEMDGESFSQRILVAH